MNARLVSFVAESLRMAAPYAACGLAAVVTERAGLVNIALEGSLVVTGLAAAVAALATGSAVLGIVAAIVVGALFSTAHALFVVRARIDAIVSGIALNLIAFGLGRVVLRVLYDSASNSPKVPGFPGLSASPILRVVSQPVFLVLVVAIAFVSFLLRRTRFGLRLRAVGENPDAAAAAGVSVPRVRVFASAFSGAIAGLGGAHLVFDQHHFDAGMSGGRGFIALAALIVGGWRVAPTMLACLCFAALEATQIALQDVLPVPPELVQLLPYVATLVLLAGVARRSRAPAGIGRDAA